MVVEMLKKIWTKPAKGKKRIRHVLVVDDEDAIRNLVRVYLDDMESRMSQASTAAEALELLKADGTIRLVILDIMLPGGSGLGLLKKMRKNPNLAKTPVVVVSGNLPLSKLQEVKAEYSRVEVLAKPFKMKELQELVERGFRTAFAKAKAVAAEPE